MVLAGISFFLMVFPMTKTNRKTWLPKVWRVRCVTTCHKPLYRISVHLAAEIFIGNVAGLSRQAVCNCWHKLRRWTWAHFHTCQSSMQCTAATGSRNQRRYDLRPLVVLSSSPRHQAQSWSPGPHPTKWTSRHAAWFLELALNNQHRLHRSPIE